MDNCLARKDERGAKPLKRRGKPWRVGRLCRTVTEMQPDLEVVSLHTDASFAVWAHGYPYRTVRWHFHPEYEIHLVTATSGRSFVGDHVGLFEPGNLILTGPNLPHNWISDVPAGSSVPERGLIVQFGEDFVRRCCDNFPEMSCVEGLLKDAAFGVQFSAEDAKAAEPLLRDMLTTHGVRRLALFFALLDVLNRSTAKRILSSQAYRSDPATYMAQPLNHVLDYIASNFATELHETEMAALSGYSLAAFSRAFRRHAGVSFVYYVNSMRIKRACDMLIADKTRIADICFLVGFANLSNFNRQFLAHKGMAPRAFRNHHHAIADLAVTAVISPPSPVTEERHWGA
ncbi:AraC family transcriptional regulator [Acidisoma silvae]|uniref:AraC family transcriptional regulator n=1 Tax=Acidisoma silvae TaxID=2802396 RepID=A0A963YW49_9PROT|nr:AraC family transcriptional regulator [Acidisoma silvae]MCB8878302.1 AraC family transcriptional regulator [Acidisoma silvae]